MEKIESIPDFPVERLGIRFYKFFFDGIKNPVIIEADTKGSARLTLDNLRRSLPGHYADRAITGESVSLPLKGISKKVIGKDTFIWVGYEKSPNGWMQESIYKTELKKY